MPAGITSTDSMFSLKQTPWHGLGVVLDHQPDGIDEALSAAGLEWKVVSNAVYRAKVIYDPETQQPEMSYEPIEGYRANVREDTDEVLGVVTGSFQIVDNRDGFRFLDALLNSDLLFETAGSLNGGRRVFVTCRLPEWIEVAGDPTGIYLYVANGHDGTLSFTVAPTGIRIVCWNTFSAAVSATEKIAWRFRHVGNVVDRAYEARTALGMTLNFEKQFKALGDELGMEKIRSDRFERKVLRELFKADPDAGKVARANRDNSVEMVLNIFRGHGPRGDTAGNAPGTKWTAFNAVGEYADWCRRYTQRTNQVSRSFEDNWLKRRALSLIKAA